MIENLNGLCNVEITLLANDNVKPGSPVEIEDKYTVCVPSLNSRFMGICTSVNGKYATIVTSGIVTVPYSGSNIVLGYNTLSSDGNGKLKFDLNGDVYIPVLDMDEENGLITILLK